MDSVQIVPPSEGGSFVDNFLNISSISMENNIAQKAMIDVHAPNKVRVNAVLSAMPEFYEVYGVMPGNGLYQAPENRPAVW